MEAELVSVHDGQLDVEDAYLRHEGSRLFQRLNGIGRQHDLVTNVLQGLLDGNGGIDVVVYDEDPSPTASSGPPVSSILVRVAVFVGHGLTEIFEVMTSW